MKGQTKKSERIYRIKGGVREGQERNGIEGRVEGSSMEGQSGREQKLQLAKKQFESRVRARFGSETCTPLRCFISL